MKILQKVLGKCVLGKISLKFQASFCSRINLPSNSIFHWLSEVPSSLLTFPSSWAHIPTDTPSCGALAALWCSVMLLSPGPAVPLPGLLSLHSPILGGSPRHVFFTVLVISMSLGRLFLKSCWRFLNVTGRRIILQVLALVLGIFLSWKLLFCAAPHPPSQSPQKREVQALLLFKVCVCFGWKYSGDQRELHSGHGSQTGEIFWFSCH